VEVKDALSAQRIEAGLDTKTVGRNLLYLAETRSTNDEARRLAEARAAEGTLIVTDYQSAGRGRLNRQWEAPRGSSLLMSLIFRPALQAGQLQRLTMICGLAVLDAIELEISLRAGLKWPNDVVIGDAKVGGILTESGLRGDRVEYVVVGVGLNVNLEPDELSEGLLMPATSLSAAVGRKVARLPLLWAFLRSVEARYERLKAGESPQQAWAQELVTVGRPVTVSTGEISVHGVAEGVDADGALIVRLPDGRLQRVVAGDVTLRAEAGLAGA
jgi:BirA family biotin operon repressor/biotin-[acetyl-CoA-carboxylase] ligase